MPTNPTLPPSTVGSRRSLEPFPLGRTMPFLGISSRLATSAPPPAADAATHPPAGVPQPPPYTPGPTEGDKRHRRQKGKGAAPKPVPAGVGAPGRASRPASSPPPPVLPGQTGWGAPAPPSPGLPGQPGRSGARKPAQVPGLKTRRVAGDGTVYTTSRGTARARTARSRPQTRPAATRVRRKSRLLTWIVLVPLVLSFGGGLIDMVRGRIDELTSDPSFITDEVGIDFDAVSATDPAAPPEADGPEQVDGADPLTSGFVWDSDASRRWDKAEPMVLQEGRYTVGTDVPPGRYTVTPVDPADYALLALMPPEADYYVPNIALGGDGTEGWGPASFTATLSGPLELEVGSLGGLALTPQPVHATPDVFAQGMYLVGRELPAGVYRLTARGPFSGNILVADGAVMDSLSPNVALDPAEETAPSSGEFELEDGDLVFIWNLAEVTAEVVG